MQVRVRWVEVALVGAGSRSKGIRAGREGAEVRSRGIGAGLWVEMSTQRATEGRRLRTTTALLKGVKAGEG